MPLLGKRIFYCVKPLTDLKEEEQVYTIPHTKERFRSKVEYDKRVDLYNQRIWQCQCTGHLSLTHEEAWNSEKAVKQSLTENFSECYEKSVLEIVHHNTVALESLVDQAWLKVQQVLCIGEKVCLKIKKGGQLIKGTVVGIDISGVEANPTSNCSSPSSDKENATAAESNDTGSPKKWVPPKLLPYKYNVNLTEEDKIINGIPAAELTRIDRPPPKEFIRLFIRASALRHGTASTSPWVVNDDLVAKYHLPSKFADFLLSPAKMAEAAKRAEEEVSKKRKLVKKGSAGGAKKLKAEKGEEKKPRKRKLKDGDAKPRKNGATPAKKPKLFKSPKKDKPKSGDSASKSHSPKKKKKVKSCEVITIETDSSDDEVALATLKKKTTADVDSDSDVPLANLTNHTPKKASPKKVKVKKDKDTPKAKGAKSPGKKSKEQKDKSPAKKKAKVADSNTPTKKRGRPKKDSAEKEKGKKTPSQKSPKKSMKQLTLLDMSKGKDQSMQEKTPRKSTASTKASTPGTPAIAKKLIKLKKSDEKIKFGQLLKKAALILTSAQRNNLPLEIRDFVQKKFEKIEEKKLMEKMGPEEREAYMKVRREKMRIQQMETQRQKRKKFDERDLTLSPIPAPKLVVTPDGLSNGAFGDVAMVTELISCYSGLLMPQDEYPIYADALMKALCGDTKGFTYLSRVLVVLLQTLLQDEIAEDYKELRVALVDIPLNAYTASEMVRLCLRRQDLNDNSNDLDDHDVPDAVVQQLAEKEFYQLSPQDKLQVLKALCLRVLGTYSVQDYMEEKQKEATVLVKQKTAGQKEMNEKLKEKKELLKEKTEKLKKVKEQAKYDSDSAKASPAPASGTESNGKSDEKGPGEEKCNDGADPTEADEDNLVAIIRRRRVLAAKAAAEKERQDKERKIQREKEFEEERLRRDKENFEKMFKEGILLAKMVLRQTPLGSDRDHGRYWIFTNTTPGLFVEKGWVTKDMEYCVAPSSPAKSETSALSLPSTPAKQGGAPSLPSTPAKQGSTTSLSVSPNKRGRKRKSDWANSSIPDVGPNQWFVYESVKDLDTLVDALHPQGCRESALRAEIKKHYDIVSKSILSAQRTNNELRDSDGDTEMMAALKKEMVDMELRLRNGGLGGVPDYEKWEAKVLSAADLKSLGPCLVQMQGSILEKFFQGFMKPITKKTQEKINDVKEEPETEEEDENEEEVEEVGKKDARTRAVEAWQEAVLNCQTVSRLHVLVGMLDSCVKWEKSAENAKCKICRKKCDDDRLLLCDECNQAFHMYCLRPQILAVPRGDWFCPACVPMNRRRCNDAGRNYKEASSDDDDKEEEEKEENCQECGGDEGLIFCSKCPAAFHPECHDPPLRHPPRGRWVCTNCKTGRGRKTRSGRQNSRALRASRTASKKRNNASDEEEESEDEEDEEEDEEVSDEDEAEEVLEAVQRSTRESSRQSKSVRNSRSSHSTRTAAREVVVENYGPSRTSKRPPSELSICENILARLVKHNNSWPFLEPVDKREVPDYHVIIRHPMDFQTIRQKLGRLSYSSAKEFIEDVNLVFRNAEEYNKRDSEVFVCMVELEKLFMDQLSKQLPYSASTMAAYNGFADTSSSRRRLRR